MMTIQRLHELFDENPEQAKLGFDGSCHDAGKRSRSEWRLPLRASRSAAVRYTSRSPAYFLPNARRVSKRIHTSRIIAAAKVYSRVVGYLRPIEQWNEGKQAEFRERKAYRV